MFTNAPITGLGQAIEVTVVPEPRRLEISLAQSRSDLQGAFQILYHSYVRAGLIDENPLQVRLTPFHLLPTTEVVVAKLQNTVTSTLTLVVDSPAGLPMDEMYGDELDRFRSQGLRLAEVGCLADRRRSPVRFIKVFGELARLSVQVACARGIGALVVVAHPRHERFYTRSFGFERFGTVKECPYVNGNPAVAMILEFARIQRTEWHQCLFGNPYTHRAFSRAPWDQETLDYLQQLVNATVSQKPEIRVRD
jgi:hypothetical protein